MNSEVKDRLITGLAQYLSAQSAGSSKFAIADGYLAIDNHFSAILLSFGIDPTRNHQRKLSLMLSRFGSLLNNAGISNDELNEYYECWQNVRYTTTSPTPKETLHFLRLSNRIISTIRKEIALQNNLSDEDLEEELYSEVLGSRWSSFEEECSQIHEMWQQDAELQGEMGIGSKLGNKMLNPSNFCDIRALADDTITKNIIANDSEFGTKVAYFYQSFLKLVMYIHNTRLKKGVEYNDVPNYILSLRLRYQGMSMEEITEEFDRLFNDAKIKEAIQNAIQFNDIDEDTE